MKNRIVAFAAVAVVGIVALWWVFVYSPLGQDLDDAVDEREQAEREEASLTAQLRQLQEIDRNAPETDAELAQLAEAIPENPDLADFFLTANEIAVQSGIDWLSVSPAEPAPTPGSPSVIRLNMQLSGGFFQVLDYLNRLEDLDRLVVIDALNLSAGAGGDGTGGSTAGAFDGAPTLSATITARMFTLATVIGPTPTTTTTVPGATTTPEAAGTTTEVAN